MKWGRVGIVVFGAIIITALGIDAADTLNGSQDTLLSRVIQTDNGKCPPGMSPVDNMVTVTCIDTFEASTSESCPVKDPEQMLGTMKNLESKECVVESKKDILPWRFITRDQAMQMCARVGKRLPTSEEWYALSLGMTNVENTCNVSSDQISTSGSSDSCISPHGAYDLVGNVWEWVSDDIIGGVYKTTTLPSSGYVTQVDATGMATVIDQNPQELFGSDYFWSRSDGAYGVIRGGYFDSGTDAGIYTVHADTPPTSASPGIGFRCVK